MSKVVQQNSNARQHRTDEDHTVTQFSQAIGRTRYVVGLAIVAVILVAISLFLLGTIQAALSIWNAWTGTLQGEMGSTNLTVEFLEIVSVMLRAVVFYIIGVGLYSLFIAPLNLTISLGVETLSDLESKVISVVIVIMSVTFLEHFIRWENSLETLQFGGALALVIASLVLFQMYSHRTKEDQRTHNPDIQERAKRDLFKDDREEQAIRPDQIHGTKHNEES